MIKQHPMMGTQVDESINPWWTKHTWCIASGCQILSDMRLCAHIVIAQDIILNHLQCLGFCQHLLAVTINLSAKDAHYRI